eukprot:EG_transcript_13889
MAATYFYAVALTFILLFGVIQATETQRAAEGPTPTQTPPNATEACRRKQNHIWNGTVCVPGCEGFQYLEDGICLSRLRRISAQIQFALCVVAIGASFLLLPPEHAFLRPFLLAAIGFGLLVNTTTWEVLHNLPAMSVYVAKGSVYVAVQSLIVSFWTYTDLAVLYLMILAPSIPAQLRAPSEPLSQKLTALAKLLVIPLLLYFRGRDFVFSLPHLAPVYLAAIAFAPVMRAGLEDPHAVENVKALQSMVREMTLGEVLLFYGLVAGCFLLPVVRIVAHFLPDIFYSTLLTVEVVLLGAKASLLKWHLQVILDLAPRPEPTPKGQAR